MIRSAFFTLLLLFILSGVSAQTKVGFRAGLNFGKDEDGTGDFDPKLHTGFVLGVVVEWPLFHNKFRLLSELLYSMKGSKSEGYSQLDRADFESINQFNYLMLPVNIVYRKGKISIFAGPYGAVFISGRYTTEYDYGRETYKWSGRVKATDNVDNLSTDFGFIKPFDYGVNFGLEVSLSSEVSVSSRYEWGLHNITPNLLGRSERTGDHKYLNISLVYFLPQEN